MCPVLTALFPNCKLENFDQLSNINIGFAPVFILLIDIYSGQLCV